MARNKKNNYFEMLTNHTNFSVQAAELLKTMFCDYCPEKSMTLYQQMHEIENNADTLQHEILTMLSTEFITPIDQEDILQLTQILDNITDAIDEVTLDFYMYNLKAVPLGGDKLAEQVLNCVNCLHSAVGELKNFKKPDKLRAFIIDMNTAESDADEVYIKSVHTLFSSEIDPKVLIGSYRVLESLENCCDLCEHAADVMEQIIIKNT